MKDTTNIPEQNLFDTQAVINKIQTYRRACNSHLQALILAKEDIPNLEDLVRLVGNLNCAVEHLSIAVDAKTQSSALFCVLKHLSTALILATEVYETSSEVAEMIGLVSNGLYKTCMDCENDKKGVTTHGL